MNDLENCVLTMQYINASNIILGIANHLDPDDPIDQVFLILKYYIYINVDVWVI